MKVQLGSRDPRDTVGKPVSDPQMRALTLHQPWAWAFCHGKLLENRNLAGNFKRGEPVAIHAGVSTVSMSALWSIDSGWSCWPVGRDLPPDPDMFLDLRKSEPPTEGDPAAVLGGVVAVAIFDRVVTKRLPKTSGQSDWRGDSSHALLFSESVPLARPIPCAGRQGPFRLTAEISEQVIEAWYRQIT